MHLCEFDRQAFWNSVAKVTHTYAGGHTRTGHRNSRVGPPEVPRNLTQTETITPYALREYEESSLHPKQIIGVLGEGAVPATRISTVPF